MGGLDMWFDPDKDIPELQGKVFFITGGTAGLGKQTVLALSRHSPAHIYFTGRNEAAASKVIQEAQTTTPGAQITFIQCDQKSLASARDAAARFRAAAGPSSRLDVLICNAGIMAVPPGTTEDGYEVQFGVNHMAHAMLIRELLPLLERTADARIVLLTSLAFQGAPPKGGIVFKDLKSEQDGFSVAGGWVRYGQSKLANVLYAAELAGRYPGIRTVAVHPGVIFTDLVQSLGWFNRFFVWATTFGMRVEEHQGAHNTLWAATTPDKSRLENGAFYEPVGKKGDQTKTSLSQELRTELWDWTQKELANVK